MLKKAMYLPSTPRTPTVVTAVYDLAGNLTDLTYPDGRHIKESRDGAGLLTQIADLTQPTDNSNGYSYLTASSYWPNGAPQTVWYGNGAAVGYHLNNRLQIDEISDVRIGTGSYTGGNVLAEKHLCFGPATSPLSSSVAGCPTLANGNNGNILQIRDELTGTRTQTFNYDSLNRLTNFVRADGSMQQTYAYDSFGNMTQTSPGTLQTNLVFNPNNQSVNDDYDAVGNLVAHNNGVFTSAYIYDAENKLVNVNGGAATYSYDANGDRVRKDVSPNWTEYVRFNGQSVAERGSDGAWSDYIYANGQRIARADGYDIRIHMSGTNCSNCGSNPNMFAGVTSLTAANGYTIRNGDILAWRQYQDGSTTGGLYLIFTDGTDGLAKRDTDGQLLDQDTTMNAWHMRIVDLTQFAGKTVQLIDPFQWTSAPAGNWDIYYGDIVLTSADGTSIPIYSRTMTTLSPATNPSISNFSAITEKVSDNTPLTTTTYYHGDQVGSTHLLTSGGGWPISSDTYYPFGAEAGPAGDANHYKFTGKERDSESGLDYFGARYYTSTMGRWMSPDWAAKPEAVPYSSLDNPQSLNLYGYVLNNPLSHADADGHCCESDFNSFSDHPGSFTGSSGGDGAIFAPIKQFMADHPVLTNLGINLGLAIITRGEGGEVGMPRLTEGGEAVPSAPSMGAAQRQAMQDQGIPTSQQPTTQTNTPAGKQYTYEVPKPGGGTETKVVQRNTGTDSSHPGQPHVEAGSPKPNGQTDSIGRPRLDSNKTKVNVKKPDGQ